MNSPLTLSDQNWLNHPATRQLIDAFANAGEEIRFVGGCVRDAVMGRMVKDVDACSPALPKRMLELLEAADIKTIPTGIDHGTVTAIIDKIPYEITTLREDTSCDGRHAEVAYTTDWEVDAKRRDFTMNALYCDGDGNVTDYMNGIDDAQAGRIRFIGNASDRIQEDALRILRFFRFCATHGKEPLSDEEIAACREHKAMLSDLSGERIQQEMMKLLAAPDPRYALQAMMPDILPLVIPDIENVDALDHLLDGEQHLPQRPSAIIRLAAILRTIESADDHVSWIKERWKLSNKDHATLVELTSHELIAPDALEATMKAVLRHIGKKRFAQLIALSWRKEELHVLDVAQRLAENWEAPIFPVNGADLIALGYSAGKEMGETLARLEALWESMDYAMNKEQLLATLKKD